MSDIKVPFIDLKQRFQEEKKELMPIIEKVLSKGSLVLTPELEKFEKKMSKFTGAKYCIGLNSGTDALMMGLMCAGIKPGDEVITSPISFIATVGAIAHLGAKPVFVDTGYDLNINEKNIEQAITKKTKAIVPVHWAGRVANMNAIMEIATKNNVIVVEDSAQSMGSYYNNKHGGTFGHSGCISFHPLKNLNALGDSGMLLTSDLDVYKKVKLFRNHGLESRDDCIEFGINSRLDVLNAEVLSYRLDKLHNIVIKRRENINLYRKLITAKEVFIPEDKVEQSTSYVMCLALCEKRDKLKDFLHNRGIETLVYYGKPLHLQKATSKFGYKSGDLPVSEKQAQNVLALPHHQYITVSDIEYVTDSINYFYKNL